MTALARLTPRPVAFATWVGCASPMLAEIIGKAGFDCVILDLQHSALSDGDLVGLMQALDLGGTRALVRLRWNDPALVMRALDLGAIGVVVPLVSTAAEAQRAVAASKYPPHGIRSFGPARRHPQDWADGLAQGLCFAMIETAAAMDNLDAIAATPGLDGLLVGPVDLGLSFGLPPLIAPHPQVDAAIAEVVAACRRHNLVSACAGLGPAHAEMLVAAGVQLVTLGSDLGFVRSGASAEVARGRSLLNRLMPAG